MKRFRYYILPRVCLALSVLVLLLGLWWGAAWVWSLFYSPIDDWQWSMDTGIWWLETGVLTLSPRLQDISPLLERTAAQAAPGA